MMPDFLPGQPAPLRQHYFNRCRLRETHTAARLAEIYAKPHDSSNHAEHGLRIAMTINLIQGAKREWESVADLSCGDAIIINNINAERKVRGDFAPGYLWQGPIEETLPEIEPVELFVCTETIEHLDDPDRVLRMIGTKAKWLALSTPVDAWHDPNSEHYWAWGRQGVERMLGQAGFKVSIYSSLDLRPAGSWYCFGIWLAHKR